MTNFPETGDVNDLRNFKEDEYDDEWCLERFAQHNPHVNQAELEPEQINTIILFSRIDLYADAQRRYVEKKFPQYQIQSPFDNEQPGFNLTREYLNLFVNTLLPLTDSRRLEMELKFKVMQLQFLLAQRSYLENQVEKMGGSNNLLIPQGSGKGLILPD